MNYGRTGEIYYRTICTDYKNFHRFYECVSKTLLGISTRNRFTLSISEYESDLLKAAIYDHLIQTIKKKRIKKKKNFRWNLFVCILRTIAVKLVQKSDK